MSTEKELEFEKCVVMAQQLYGIMIHIDDNIDKETVVSVLASMIGAKKVEPLTQQESDSVTALLRKLAKGMN